ncbi:MAG: efflux RND transporter permease subunit, partial [Thiohalomonadaceae bacterium]
ILSRVSIERPVFAMVISLLLLVLGLAALVQLGVREYPDIDPPVVSITTVFPGASAEVIDREITEVIEEQISGIEGIRTIDSTSRDEVSEVSIEFDLRRDVDAAAADVRDRLGAAAAELPDEADPPVVAKVSADAQPVLWISLTSDARSQLELTEFAERYLTEPLSVLPGVARVIVGGSRRRAMRIWLDMDAMAARGVTVSDVVDTLQAENVELPAGRVEGRTREFSVRSQTRLATPAEFAALVLRSEGGYQLTLDDVARVEIGPESERSAVLLNGENAVGLGVVRQSKTNTLAVTRAVREEVAALQAVLPADIRMDVAYDESVFIEASLREVLVTMLITASLVVVVIFLFLRSVRTTLVPAVTIPVSLVGTFVVMWALGHTINTLTLLALVLAIGLVVDDAIVMLENVYRRHEQGEPKLIAGARGADQVGFAIVATTLVLVVVFVPLAFIPGDTGKLFTEFGVALAAAVGFSGIAALTLGAMLSARVVETGGKGRLYRWSERGFDAVATGYQRALTKIVPRPGLVLLVAALVSVLAWFAFRQLPRELAPTEDRGVLIIPVQGPEGASFAYTRQVVDRIDELLQPFMDSGTVAASLAIIAPSRFGPAPVNEAFMIVRLAPWEVRDIPQQAIAGQLLGGLLALPEARAFAVNPPSLGQGGFLEPLQVAVGGPDYATAAAWGRQLLEAVSKLPGVVDPRIDYNESKPQLGIRLDRRRAADLGIDARQVGETLQVLFGGRDVTEFIEAARIYEVMVQAERSDTASPADLRRVFLRTGDGALVPLHSLMTVEEQGSPPELRRVNRSPSVTLSASLAPGVAFGDVLAQVEQLAAEVLPQGARLTWLGQAEIYREAQGNVALVTALALLIVFLVLAAQFESFLHPLVIMTTVPLAFTGGLMALWLGGQSFNIFAQVGLVLLIGLVTKNGILLVEFANQIRDRGQDVRSAALAAGAVRLRPVLMTSVATIFGAVPLALATGPGAEGRTAIGIVVIGGMVLSTLLTLFVVPTLYALLAPYTRPTSHWRRRLEEAERDSGEGPRL